jgi:CheY-like chemotaxis protein
VSNAVKYTRSGRILVGARRRAGLVEIQIWDTGIGIAEGELQTVFREFTRLDDGMREAQGLGLGLSIVDRIARVLRLELQLQSQPGSGTRFSVILPVSTRALTPGRERPPLIPVRQAMLEGLNILCIDNDTQILEGMRMMLEGWGCRVQTMKGLEGHESEYPEAPDFLFADYHLDRGNGLDAITKLRKAWNEDVPAVLITADRSREVRQAATAMDVAIVQKPVKPAALRALLMRYRPSQAAE